MYIDSFEDFLSAAVLRKALAIYQNGDHWSVYKLGHVYSFDFTEKAVNLELRRNARRIAGYTCSCQKRNCEHLAVACLYLSGFNTGKNEKRNTVSQQSQALQDNFALQKKIKSNLPARGLARGNNSKAFLFAYLNVCMDVSTADCKKLEDQYNLCVFDAQKELVTLLKKTHEPADRELLYYSATRSILSKHLRTAQFFFFVPLYLMFNPAGFHANNLAEKFSAIKMKYSAGLKLDLHHVTDIILQFLHRKNKLAGSGENEIVACSQIYFLKGNFKRSVNVLVSACADTPALSGVFLEFAVKRSAQLKYRKQELFFIAESFIREPFVNFNHLQRVNALLHGKSTETFIRQVLQRIKLTGKENMRKHVDLLLFLKSFDEALHLPATRKDSSGLFFKILKEKKAMHLTEQERKWYIQQISFVLTDESDTNYKKIILGAAKEVYKNLSERSKRTLRDQIETNEFLTEMLRHIPGFSIFQ